MTPAEKIAAMPRPAAPADLSRVSTWTADQKAWASLRIAEKAIAAASETYAQARDSRDLEARVELSKIAGRYLAAATYWQEVANGTNPKAPAFLNAVLVSSYEQTNGRVRPHKVRNPGPKDWGVFSGR